MMSEPYPIEEEEEERGPLWFRMLPKSMQYYLMWRALDKLIRDPETPARLQMMGDFMEESLRIMQGKERPR